jgi:hypothetical protein
MVGRRQSSPGVEASDDGRQNHVSDERLSHGREKKTVLSSV